MIIFDFDGTIADSYMVAIQFFNSVAHKYGYKQLEDHQNLRHKSLRRVLCEDLGLSWYQIPRFIMHAKSLISKVDAEKIHLFSGIADTINYLAERTTLAIATSNDSSIVHRVLENHNVRGFTYIHSGISLFGKHVAIKRILRKLNKNPEQALYIGDEVRDVEACKKIPLKIAAVSWGFNSRDSLILSKPDYIIDSPEQLCAFAP